MTISMMKVALCGSTIAVSILLFAIPLLFDRLANISRSIELDIQEVREFEDRAWFVLYKHA